MSGSTAFNNASVRCSRFSNASMYCGAGFRLRFEGWSYVHSKRYQEERISGKLFHDYQFASTVKGQGCIIGQTEVLALLRLGNGRQHRKVHKP